jgi:hypothetical protein
VLLAQAAAVAATASCLEVQMPILLLLLMQAYRLQRVS